MTGVGGSGVGETKEIGSGSGGSGVTRAEYCIIACAEVFRGDGEVMASAFGTAPALGAPTSELACESHMPYRKVFDVVWSGRRNLIMMASQIDRLGNQNISAIGEWGRPKAQLVGVRGARQHGQPRHQLLGAQPLDPVVRRAG
jgi:acyl CoA:acetate/3-ketoacid CoA transferase beta subunit